MYREKIEKYCLDCGSPIRGRADKKYCGDACRSSHYYHKKLETHAEIKRVNQCLKKNVLILEDLLGEQNTTNLPLQVLKEKGFVTHFLTSIRIDSDQKVWNKCYHIAWHMHENGMITLFKES